MTATTLTSHDLTRALALRDLADPAQGIHAVGLVAARIEAALAGALGVPVHRDPGPRVVSVTDNYDRLRYDPDALTRDSRYTRYVGDGRMLRSHTTARIPALLDRLATDGPDEFVLSAPGVCYRRDAIDRQHVGEPHQMDVWRIRRTGPALTGADLVELIGLVVTAALPGARWRTVPSPHPYTLAGREIYVDAATPGAQHGPVEVGECGLAHPALLADSGLSRAATGLAMGLGLDRLAMLAKGIDDVRLLRASDPRVAGQMGDLSPYRPVSAMPATRRDLSLAVADELDAELLGDRVRELLGPDAASLEEVTVLSQTGYAALPKAARQRMGVRPGQKNVLLRLVIRDLTRTLTAAEANHLRDRVYAGLHEGAVAEWATGG
jgi:phenylalanyl-tRNA synthetase alpha chain